MAFERNLQVVHIGGSDGLAVARPSDVEKSNTYLISKANSLKREASA